MEKKIWGILGLILSIILIGNFLRILLLKESIILGVVVFLVPGIIALIISIKEIKTHGN